MNRLAACEPRRLWRKAQDAFSNRDCESRSTWLQSRRIRATDQQALITAVFEAAQRATQGLTPLDRDRCEYAVVSVLLKEAWVAQR